ncbi:BTB/POZ domain-containing protein 9 [Elasticomyces elasticus]|nr:BTB/POZ domain-containing protein 9 [Elasticomyces elasticus]KAK3667010.1 BTB/POZ domain-containing protein 9 [Elasticomyces elasticus]KAK4933287.1 BTB/POZ domain-containing protein 9 [Elasticomyces elasticus]KAK5757359.1 BTB/POZ domain-containing protein 9 [Elasticomyces elasticus]
MAMINVGSLYGNDAFSDVTLIFHGKIFKGHKFVLSRKSSYFKRLISLSTDCIIFPGGDVGTLNGILRYIYKAEYPTITNTDESRRTHLRMTAIGDIFGIAELTAEAVSHFNDYDVSDRQTGVAMLQALSLYSSRGRHFVGKAEEIRHNHLLPALQDPLSRCSLTKQPNRAFDIVSHLATALIKLQNHDESKWKAGGYDKVLQQALEEMPMGQ